ncbi:MAG: hypothetical protein JW973_00675 [Bacteroidales bacterium]|nr:hypothetical protein [Bacteroidales bacterium]
MAMLYSPTFLISHYIARHSGYEANGYSLPYYCGLQFNLIIYLLIGLLYLRKVLLKYFNEWIVFMTLLIVFFGTNLLYYASYNAPFPHGYEFSLIAVFIYYTIRWYEKPCLRYSIYLGLLGGIITLIRPTNIIIFIPFVFWKVIKFNELRERILFFIKNSYLLLAIIFFFILIWIPQFLYWKYITGKFLFFSYGPGAHFDFLTPHIIKGLFSYTKGWLLYTPVMVFSLLGIVVSFFKQKEWFIPLLIFTILNIYVVLSWFCWWYGGSYGQRAFIDSYSILSLPLAAFIAWTFNKGPAIKYSFILIVLLSISLNLFQTRQYVDNIIDPAKMSKKAYWKIFLKLNPSKEYYNYLKDPWNDSN